MSDRRIDDWSQTLVELQPRVSDPERYRQLWHVAANALSAFAYANGRAEGLALVLTLPPPARPEPEHADD